uniref:PB1-like domain-containing protein n=1 Tax=Chenopodium quinoa TaxID=63459 RepID=A0A803NB66_CHEQI
MADDISPYIILHHEGQWKNNPISEYVGGQVKVFNELGDDFYGTFLKSLINSLGYNNVIKLHYCDPLKNMSNGVRFLSYDDCTFTKFKSILFEYKIVDVYIEHDHEDVHGFDIGSGNAFGCSSQSFVVDEPEEVGLGQNACIINLEDFIYYEEEGSDNDDVKGREIDVSNDDGEESASDPESPPTLIMRKTVVTFSHNL